MQGDDLKYKQLYNIINNQTRPKPKKKQSPIQKTDNLYTNAAEINSPQDEVMADSTEA